MKINNIFKNKIKGFTLLELIVVIAIIAILAVIALPSFTSSLAKARDARKIADVRTIHSEISAYYAGIATSTVHSQTTSPVFASTGKVSSPAGATTTLQTIYNAMNRPVPAIVQSSEIAYYSYDSDKKYYIFVKLENGDSTALTSSATSSTFNSAGGTNSNNTNLLSVGY